MDRRTYLKTTGGAVTGISLAGCLGGLGGGDDSEIVAGTAPGFPPFEMKEGGDLVGFDVDLLSAVVEETDYTLADEWEEFEFDSLIPALQNDRIDVIAAAMTIEPGREETIAFSDPYYDANQSVLVSEDATVDWQSLEDLEGATVGAQSGTTGESVVESELIEPGVIAQGDYNTYDNYVLGVEDLENGNVDALVLDVPVAETFASERAVTVAFTHETDEQYGFGLRQGEEELQTALNDGLAAVRDSGRYDELVNEWFGN
jgi:polar amino acid transport system substrate-binding protein